MENIKAINISSLSQPKGGGAVYGLGESMGAVGPDGLATLSIPLPVSAGRGMAPQMSLGYSSGAGNGPFGLGWSCEVPTFSLRTAKGTPAYDGNDEFLGPDGEVLVPVATGQGLPEIRTARMLRGTDLKQTYSITRWQPRIVSGATCMEFWQPPATSQDQPFWVLFSPDGDIHLFGKNAQARISDPQDENRIARWLPEESISPTGEHIYYYWQAEDDVGCDNTERAQHSASAQRYLVKVGYGNLVASPAFFALDGTLPADQAWLFHLIFDYGERSSSMNVVPAFATDNQWAVRADSFSRYEYGFEIRTRRLCRQVLMFHRLKALAGSSDEHEVPALVSRLILQYEMDPRAALLLSLRSLAHEADGTPVTQPPLEFDYQRFVSLPPGDWQPVPALRKLNARQPYQLVDLYGEGVPGVLYQDALGAWWYSEPVRDTTSASVDAVTWCDPKPLPQIPRQQQQAVLMDINGDGQMDWVITAGGVHGYHTLTQDRLWTPFIPLPTLPVEYFHPRSRLTDVACAGLPDLALIGPKSVRVWSNNLEGWGKGKDVAHKGLPLAVPGYDDRRLVAFADMNGAGRQHLVELTAEGIRYWPNLGHGRFGDPVTMAGFSLNAGLFNPQHLYMVDMDGSGTTDLIYARHGELVLWVNECGNRFADPVVIALPEGVKFDDTCRLQIADVQGLGASSLILTVPHMDVQHWRLDLSSCKPWLLNAMNNNMGADTTLFYRSSAQFWLDEKEQARAARNVAVSYLPFPVHLLCHTVTLDEITGNRLVSRYDYAHGVWDGREREYRGFARVTQTDCNELASASRGAQVAPPAPSRCVSWFATGNSEVDDVLAQEYWQGDSLAATGFTARYTRFDALLGRDVAFTPDEEQRYWLNRALKGGTLRSELYGEDGSVQAGIPYTVSESRSQARLLDGVAGSAPAVRPSVAETRHYRYERIATDPQCAQEMVLASDSLGNITDFLSVAYPRRPQPAESPYPDKLPGTLFASSYDEQQQVLRLTRKRFSFVQITDDDVWVPVLPHITRSDAVAYSPDVAPAGGLTLEWVQHQGAKFLPASEVSYLGHEKAFYLSSSDQPSFPPRVTYIETAEFNASSLSAFEGYLAPEALTDQLKKAGWTSVSVPFENEDGFTVWAALHNYSDYAGADGFYRPVSQRPTLLTDKTVTEWDPHYCVVISEQGAGGATARAGYDYRFLSANEIIDVNDNTWFATFDALGRATSTRFWGTEGDVMTGYTPPDQEETPFTLPDNIEDALALTSAIPVSGFMIYEPQSWMISSHGVEGKLKDIADEEGAIGRLAFRRFTTDQGTLILAPSDAIPPHTLAVSTDRYDSDPQQQLRQSITFNDGFGRTLQTCAKDEAGEAWCLGCNGQLLSDDEGKPIAEWTDSRWVISGRIEYDAKGRAVRQYHPYFLNSWHYVRDDSARQDLFASTHYFDPQGNVYQVVNAAGYLKRTLSTPWFVVTEDENDTATEVIARKETQCH